MNAALPNAGHLTVVGSGVAGLYAALLAVEAGARVTLLTKGGLGQSNTHKAQGGICAVLPEGEAAPGDTVEAHIADTLKAGAGQCDPEAVRILCTEAAGDIAAVERFGVVFDRDATGRRALGLEGAHSAARILHAGGDATGAAISNGLIAAVRQGAAHGRITVLEHAVVRDLLVDNRLGGGGRVVGVSYRRHFPESGGGGVSASMDLMSDGVLLATGGAGQLFAATTNPGVATADGVGLAWRAGAVLADLEYFQFHPTALAVGENFLISEAVRGAGAVLRDAGGEAFMSRYHPDGDLAPRDVVSRSIAAHLRTGQAGRGENQRVYLDATGVEAAHGTGYLRRRFPTIDATTRALGFDWSAEWLPVTPAAHYWMGGIATTVNAETSLPGLFAAGEAACTGVHGANRLASNSLLEGLVFGRRAVAAFLAGPSGTADAAIAASATQLRGAADQDSTMWAENMWTEDMWAEEPRAEDPCGEHCSAASFSREALRALMGSHAGVVRDAAGLRHAARVLAGWRSQPGAREGEERNLLIVAELLVHAALARENSVGAHFRSDFPQGPADTTTNHRASHHWVNPAPYVTNLKTQRESETV